MAGMRILFLFFLLLAAPLSAETLAGPVRIVDADTIDIGAGANVRLLGIDAAEAAQTCKDAAGRVRPCGSYATAGARQLYEGRIARCLGTRRDRYGRILAICHVAGQDMNARLVRTGLAQTYRDDPRYAAEQREARRASRGLWAYEMADPAAWRARRRAAPAQTDEAPAGACTIKGNISGNGRIYHLPGGRFYGPTRINPDRGERWFCSEREAREAGWRRARG